MPTPCNNGLETPILNTDPCNGKRTIANCVIDETLYSQLGLESNSTQKQINQAQYLASINQKVRVDDIDDRVTLLEVEGGSESEGAVEGSRLSIESLINTNSLIVGKTYVITNADIPLYGGTRISLTAVSTNQLSLQGSGLFYCPKYDVSNFGTGYGIWTKHMEGSFSNIVGTFISEETVTAQNGATAIYLAEGFLNYISGDWSLATSISGATATADVSDFVSPSYSIGQQVHWGGKTWTNINGNIGESVDKYTLDSEWLEIAFNATDYNVYIDEIHYDYVNDMIIYRKDKYNNVVSGSQQVFEEFQSPNGYGLGNPIKDFQWGCMQNDFNTNDYFNLGIQNNKVIDSYFETLNSRAEYIWQNILNQESTIDLNIISKNSKISKNNLTSGSITLNVIANISSIVSNNLHSSQIVRNTLSNAQIGFNILKISYISENTILNSSAISQNLLKSNSSISQNILIQNSSISDNVLKISVISENKLRNSFISSNVLNQSDVNFKLTGLLSSLYVNDLDFKNIGTAIFPDLSTATIIFQNYPRTLTTRQDGTLRIGYIDNSDTQVFVPITT